jgi:flagellar protein FliO/FliZ
MDSGSLAKVALVLVFVVSLIGLLALVARALKLPEKWSGAGIRSRRMEVKEVLYIDAKNKVILLRRDEAEHLILIGTNGASMIESNIVTGGGESHAKAS